MTPPFQPFPGLLTDSMLPKVDKPPYNIMVHPLSVDDSVTVPKRTNQSGIRSSIFNVYLFLISLCSIAALVIAAISLDRGTAFTSSLFMNDMERTFNSTVYAIAYAPPIAPACHDLSAEVVTGQTSIPGQCVNVGDDSYSMWVTRLAQNCQPFLYAEGNCSGIFRKLTNISAPYCVVAAAAGELAGNSGDYFKSFQILCT